MRLTLFAALLLVGAGCSHAPPPTEATKHERHDDWVAALKSDLERIAPNDGFEGRVRVMHAGTAEIDRTFGTATCLPLGVGRRLLAAIAVGVLVDGGKLGWDDRLERRLPSTAGTSFAPLSVANLLTQSAGLALDSGGASGLGLDSRIDLAAKSPLRAAPGTLVEPADDRPWVLVERLVAQVSGEPFEGFVEHRIASPAGMTRTSLGPSVSCPEPTGGTTTLEDQLRLIDALRAGKVVSPRIRQELWEPRLPLSPGSDMAYGVLVRSNGEQRAVGLSAEGNAPAYELWLDPAGADALVLLGRTPAKTARGVRTALGEFYALPPGPPHSSTPARRPPSR
ncbi:MAG TPA: serine hydrolase domain-containing protein [Myxococcaceae bacterium]